MPKEEAVHGNSFKLFRTKMMSKCLKFVLCKLYDVRLVLYK